MTGLTRPAALRSHPGAAPLPEGEFGRLLALARYEILDTAPEEAFDRVTSLTAELLDMEVAVVNFVDQYRQWGKSCVGVGSTEAPREDSFCAWTILGDEVLVVHDAHADPRFRDNPMVTGLPRIHRYAGAPLVTAGGHRLGTLCVASSRPGPFGPREQGVLKRFAAIVMDALEWRLRLRQLERQLDGKARLVEDLRRSAAHARTLAEISRVLEESASPDEALPRAAALLGAATDVAWIGCLTERPGERGGPLSGHPLWRRAAAPGGVDRLCGPSGQGVARTALHRGEAVWVGDGVDLGPGVRTGSLAALPLGAAEGTRSVLLAARLDGARPWDDADRALYAAAGRSIRASLERRDHLRAMERAARHDALTGLLNRRALDEALEACQRDGTPFCVMVVDLDGMKAVNDREGHERGDALLRLFAQVLRGEFRATDRMYRLGGDEFALLLPGPREDAAFHQDLLARVDRAVAATRAGGFSGMGASAGVAAWKPGTPVLQTLHAADQDMYRHKAGRQRPPRH